jgi:hypothetical protein
MQTLFDLERQSVLAQRRNGVREEGVRYGTLRYRATCAMTPSGETTGVQSRPANSSRSITRRGP